jgi:hypothetical protein
MTTAGGIGPPAAWVAMSPAVSSPGLLADSPWLLGSWLGPGIPAGHRFRDPDAGSSVPLPVTDAPGFSRGLVTARPRYAPWSR